MKLIVNLMLRSVMIFNISFYSMISTSAIASNLFVDTNYKSTVRSYLNYHEFNKNNPINPNNKNFNITYPRNFNQIEWSIEHPLNKKLDFHIWNVNDFSPLGHKSKLLEGNFRFHTDQYIIQIGKVRINWGSGFGRDPFDIFRKYPMISFDPDNEPQLQEGTNLLLSNYSNESCSLTFVLSDRSNERPRVPGLQAASMASFKLNNTEIIGLLHRRFGVDTSFGIGSNTLITDNIILRTALLTTDLRDRGIGILQSPPISTGQGLILPARYAFTNNMSQKGQFYRLLLDVDYTFADSQLIQLAYYSTTHGYSTNEWNVIADGIKASNQLSAWNQTNYPFMSAFGNPYRAFLLNVGSTLSNVPLRKNYLSLYYSTNQKFQKWQFKFGVEKCLDDNSLVYNVGFNYYLTDSITVKPSLTVFRGKTISQYGLAPNQLIAKLLLRLDL